MNIGWQSSSFSEKALRSKIPTALADKNGYNDLQGHFDSRTASLHLLDLYSTIRCSFQVAEADLLPNVRAYNITASSEITFPYIHASVLSPTPSGCRRRLSSFLPFLPSSMPRFERNRFSTGAVVQNHLLRFDDPLARGFCPILVSWVHWSPCLSWLRGCQLAVVRCGGEYCLPDDGGWALTSYRKYLEW